MRPGDNPVASRSQERPGSLQSGYRNCVGGRWRPGTPSRRDPSHNESKRTMFRMSRVAAWIAGPCGLLVGLCAGPALAQQEAAVQAGVQYLRTRAGHHQVGESAMMALAMLKAEVPVSDPALAGYLAKIRARFSSSEYAPERGAGQGAYEAGATAMALA